MHMIAGATDRMRYSVHPTDNATKIFVHTYPQRGREPRLTILGAEDQMVMKRRWVEGMSQFLALRPERNSLAACAPPVVPLRFTTG
jgi:hypothetical protein